MNYYFCINCILIVYSTNIVIDCYLVIIMSVKLTKTYVDSLPFAEKNQATIYRDSELIGFALRVTSQKKTYIAEKKLHGTPCRVTIGTHGEWTVVQAREKARELLYLISQGINPNQQKKENTTQVQKQKSLDKLIPTFIQAYNLYRQKTTKTGKPLKKTSLQTYDKCIHDYFSDWHDKKLSDITQKMILERHAKLTERSPAQANIAARLLHGIFSYAQIKYLDDDSNPILSDENPAKIIKKTKSMNKIKRRRTYIRNDQLGDWAVAVATTHWRRQQDNNVWAYLNQDFLFVIALTGFRRNEVESLKWENIDLKYGTITITDTKNDEPLMLPMGKVLWHILSERYKRADGTAYVFMNFELTSHVIDKRDARAKVTEKSGIQFTFHDLRRTFSSVANRLAIGSYTIKRLINHTIEEDPYDVTDGYVQVSFEDLQKAMNMIEDVILPEEMRHLIFNRKFKK